MSSEVMSIQQVRATFRRAYGEVRSLSARAGIDRHETARAADAQAAFASDVQCGQLSTVDAFETRCEPSRTGPRRSPIWENFHYVSGSNDYFVTPTTSGPRLELEHLDRSCGKASTY